jgi:glutathione synthase/RimK-type ligase-like ATP-grasp enzyme
MIIIYGQLDDPPIARAIRAAQDEGLEYLVLDQAHLDRQDLIVEVGPSGVRGRIVAAGREIPLNDVSGVYLRPLELPTRWADALARLRAHAFHQAFLEWLDVASTLVVNRPSSMDFNSSKPLQIQAIARAGFLVPETLVTSDPGEVRTFWDHHGRVIFKSVSGVRSIVQELDEAGARRLDRVRDLPTQFQAYVPGVDVRVHVVGDRTFAAEVRSPAIDYRYAGRAGAEAEVTAAELGDEVQERCLALARQFDLAFCGIDLRRRPDGEHVCFEVNPMPAYSYYESHTGLPISQALVDLLAGRGEGMRGETNGPSHRESDTHQRADRGSPTAPEPSGL